VHNDDKDAANGDKDHEAQDVHDDDEDAANVATDDKDDDKDAANSEKKTKLRNCKVMMTMLPLVQVTRVICYLKACSAMSQKNMVLTLRCY